MLLSITNLTTHDTEFQDPTGNTTFKVKVPASTTVSNVVVSEDAFQAIEAALIAETTASRITWTLKTDPSSLADSVPHNITTALTTPVTVAADADVIYTDLTAPGAVSVVLPVAAKIGAEVTVLDGKGDAGANNITVTVASAGTINGGANLVISTNRGGARFIKTAATEWRGLYLVGATGAPTGAAGGALAGSYPNPTLAANALSADAGGRAAMATDYFNAATVLLKIADGAFAADTATRALFGAGIWLEDQMSDTIAGVAQTLSGAGAVDVTHRTTKLTSTGVGDALTLADGVSVGQRKTIIHAVDGGSMVLTPTSPAVFATITFTNVRDWCELEWNGAAWDLVAFGGVTFT